MLPLLLLRLTLGRSGKIELPFGTAENPIMINFVGIWNGIKWLINKLKRKSKMCFKRLFGGGTTQPVGEVEKLALLFGINDYQGSANDLSGCVNDVNDVEKKLKAEFPDFVIRKFTDSQVTTTLMMSEIENALAKVKKVLYIHYSGHGTQIGSQEALYLYNGPLMDSVMCDFQNKTPDYLHVIAKFDSCFSGGMDDRHMNPVYIKPRFYAVPGVKITPKSEKPFAKADVQKWVIFSGCGEFQTSADAYINGRYNGAFTYYDNKSYDALSTYTKEYNKLRTFLPAGYYDQIPELTGNESLFNNQVLI